MKRSFLAEQRSENQAIIIRDFSQIERSVTDNQYALITALRNSNDLIGSLKIRAVRAIYDAYTIALQVGFIFAPVIARQKYFVWNDVTFINLLRYDEEEQNDPRKQAIMVAVAIPRALANKAADDMGSKKLGEVYKHLAEQGNLEGFRKMLNFSLILRSKPSSWNSAADNVVSSTHKTALYLRYMLGITMRQFHEEVNTGRDRSTLKRIVATIRAKRDLRKENPGSHLISRVIQRLDEKDFFKDKE